MRSSRLCLIFALTALVAVSAHAQLPGCKRLPEDRSITFCQPDGVTTATTVSITGWVTDSLPHTTSAYIDNQSPSQIPDTFGFSIFGIDEDIHNLKLVVHDASGTFSKTFSWRQSSQLPCSIPTVDRTFHVCQPNSKQIGTSPVHLAAVARSSINLQYIQTYIDGKSVTTSSAGTASLKIINQFVFLSLGTHRITYLAKDVNGTIFKATSFTIQVVSAP